MNSMNKKNDPENTARIEHFQPAFHSTMCLRTQNGEKFYFDLMFHFDSFNFICRYVVHFFQCPKIAAVRSDINRHQEMFPLEMRNVMNVTCASVQ